MGGLARGSNRDLPNPTGSSSVSRCCAKCKTPFGHSAQAGVCCHAEDKDDA